MNFNRRDPPPPRRDGRARHPHPLGGPHAQAVEVRRPGAPGRPGADQGQRRDDAVLLRELRRPRRDRDAAQRIAQDAAAGSWTRQKVNEKTFQKYIYHPDMPDVDLFVRPSGEQRTSNYLIWQSAYAEMVFQDVLWPDFDRAGTGGGPAWSTPPARPPFRRGAAGAAAERAGEAGPGAWCTGPAPLPYVRYAFSRRTPRTCRRSRRCARRSHSRAGRRSSRPTPRRPGPRPPRPLPQSRQTRWWWWLSVEHRR